MANSPIKNILPQETSTPLKKDFKCNAFSTPKTNNGPDCQQVVEDFKLFLDGLGIDDNDSKLDDATDSTLEDELSKLETTLKNFELDYSIQEIVHCSENNVKYFDCEDLNSSKSHVPVLEKPRNVAETVPQNNCGKISRKTTETLKEDISDYHGGQEIEKSKSVENSIHLDCKNERNGSKLVFQVSSQTSSEAGYLTLDESGKISDQVSSTTLNKDAPDNNNNPVNQTELCKYEPREDSNHPVCNNEIKGPELEFAVSPKSSSETEYLTLDESGEMLDQISTDLNDELRSNDGSVSDEQGKQEPEKNVEHPVCIPTSILVIQSSPKSSCGTDCLTLDESGEMSVSSSNNTFNKDVASNDDSVQIIEVIRTFNQKNAFGFKNISFSDIKPCVVNVTKVDSIPCKDSDNDIKTKSELCVNIEEHDITVVNIDGVFDNIVKPVVKDEIFAEEVEEVCTVAETKVTGLQTNKACLSTDNTITNYKPSEDKILVDTMPQVLLLSEESKSPRKHLNDVNKENEIVIGSSVSVSSKLLHKLDADVNKENVLDKLHVTDIVATSNEMDTKKSVVRVAEEFISHDPEENKDNNNEKWEELRKLTTNPERYRALRKRWQNISNPDPNKNLTTRRCFRRNFIRKKLTAKGVSKKIHRSADVNSDNTDNDLIRKLRKRKCPDNGNGEPEAKKAKTYPCTILYDEQIHIVKKAMHEELICVNEAEQEALNKLTYLQNLEQERLRYREGYLYRLTPNAEQLKNRQDTETLIALEHFQKEKQKIEGSRHAEISKLKAAADEIYAFHSFYNGITEDNVNTLLLTEEQVLHLRDIENYYSKISEIYENNGV